MNVKDLRVQCRRAGVSPAGGREALQERLQEAVSHGFQVDVARPGTAEDIQARSQMYARAGAPEPRGIGFGAEVPQGDGFGTNNNNYSRPDSQNVGNFLTDRPSSRVLAPPGGGSQISARPEPHPRRRPRASAGSFPLSSSPGRQDHTQC